MKLLLLFFILINIGFANNQNISRMNALKKVIQKEEYIALAINKYILQTGTIPKTNENILDWTKLVVDDYLGSDFNKINPLTSKDIDVYYDTKKNNFFIRGVVTKIDENETNYDENLAFLYNFYTSRIFRVNTLAPSDTSSEKLFAGSQVIYSSVQKEIVKILNHTSPEVNIIKLDSQDCTVGTYYYELKGNELTYKYCKSNASIAVYQKSPIYVEDINDLQYIKVKIGDVAYAKNNGTWYEYYYQGDTNPPWIPEYLGTSITTEEDENVEDLILSYIPDAKDLLFRQDGGCMLANGDIFCWGNNKYKKAGIENYGQLDKSLTPDYVNTPVMLKVQIDDTTQNSKKWYNNPFRVKFEKMAMNSTNICGLSPIFEYSSDGIAKKIGGDLFCNGSISSKYFEDLDENTTPTSILKRNKFFATGKENKLNNDDNIYLQDIVMVEDTIIMLSDAGNIYTLGRNYKGTLGIDSTDKFITANEPIKLDSGDTIFKKIFALRDIKSIGAIDENNYFWIWGERPNGKIFYKPTLLDTNRRFNKDAIFVNTNEFVLKGVDNIFYKTTGDNNIIEIRDNDNLIPSTAVSVSVFGDYYLYINEDLELKGSKDLLKCLDPDESACDKDTYTEIFSSAINKLNEKSNSLNGKTFANFANTSIFKLDNVIDEEFEDFEKKPKNWSTEEWTKLPDDGSDQIPLTNFLGRFAISNDDGNPIEVSKEFKFSDYEEHEVEIEFDFYEIGTWDGERFEVYANDELLAADHFVMDGQQYVEDSNITGEDLQDNVISQNSNYHSDQTYRYKLRTKLDKKGKLNLKFKTTLISDGPYYYVNKDGKIYNNDWAKYPESLSNESWGIDNVHVKVKETNKKFVCAMTGFGSKSQMYCWGNIARSIPLLSTSLYDIDNINKLFITQESDKKERMTYEEYHTAKKNKDGNLFLRFPTYIGGFDYGFYFK